MYAPPKIFLYKIPEGYPGTLQTVEHISNLIRQGAKDFHVRQTAIDILLQRAVKAKDYLGEIKALFEWVQQHVRYAKDPFRVEVLHSANRMLELRAGDCDDMAILLGAMLESIGHPVRLVLTGSDPLRRDFFSHIYLEVFHKGRWIPLDATMPYPMGWEPRTFVKETVAIERRPRCRPPAAPRRMKTSPLVQGGTSGGLLPNDLPRTPSLDAFGKEGEHFQRRPNMIPEDLKLQGLGAAAAVPDWLKGLVRAIRSEAMKPKDVRVKSLWDLLRERQLLRESPWLKSVLRRIWDQGLPARPRPNTTRRVVHSLRHWGILPPPAEGGAGHHPLPPGQAVRPVALKPVGSVRPAGMQPMQRAHPKAAREHPRA